MKFLNHNYLKMNSGLLKELILILLAIAVGSFLDFFSPVQTLVISLILLGLLITFEYLKKKYSIRPVLFYSLGILSLSISIFFTKWLLDPKPELIYPIGDISIGHSQINFIWDYKNARKNNKITYLFSLKRNGKIILNKKKVVDQRYPYKIPKNTKLPAKFVWSVEAKSNNSTFSSSSKTSFKIYADILQKIKYTGKLVYGMESGALHGPFVFDGDWGEGIDRKVADYICNSLEKDFNKTVDCSQAEFEWTKLFPEYEKYEEKEVKVANIFNNPLYNFDFIISGITITKKRKEIYSYKFSNPYFFPVRQAILVKPQKFAELSQKFNLDPKVPLKYQSLIEYGPEILKHIGRIVAQSKTTNYLFAKNLIKQFNSPSYLKVQGTEKLDEALNLVNGRDWDAVILDEPMALWEIHKNGHDFVILSLNKPDEENSLGVLFPASKNYDSLREKVNEIISTIWEDDKISQWTQENLRKDAKLELIPPSDPGIFHPLMKSKNN